MDRHRRHFSLIRLIENETLTRRRDAQNQAPRLCSDDQITHFIDCQRASMSFLSIEELRAFSIGCDLIHNAGVTRSHKQISSAVKYHRPDVLAFWIEEQLRLACGVDAVDLCVR